MLIHNRVTQSNHLVQASHTLSLNEKRLILCAASMIDSRGPIKDGFLKVSADSFSEVFGLDVRHAYAALEDAANRLFERDIRKYADGQIVERMRWVYHVKYQHGKGHVELGFSPTVLPHLTLLKSQFTSYQLRQIGCLNSFYSIRLYELMAQFLKTGYRYCSLEELRELLDLGSKYSDVKNLRVRVLDPAIAEVNAHTDIDVSMELRRKGRKVIGFSFAITKSDQMALPL